MFVILLFCIIIIIFILKPSSVDIKLSDVRKETFCDYFTGTWNGQNCICKYPEFITNNHYNGNCDRILDVNCKKILDSDGELLNFKTHNPYTEGICDCGSYYYYDVFTRKCVLKRLNSPPNIIKKIENCEDGYYFSKKYHTCLKKLCFWDILNVVERVDQENISEAICKCDFIKGFVPISLINGIVGCTKVLENNGWSRNHIILLEKKNTKDWKIFHLYPLSALGYKFKTYLNQDYDVSEDDSGGQMLAIQQSHGNWLNDILSKGVTFDSQKEYDNMEKHNRVLIFYDSSTNKLNIQIKND